MSSTEASTSLSQGEANSAALIRQRLAGGLGSVATLPDVMEEALHAHRFLLNLRSETNQPRYEARLDEPTIYESSYGGTLTFTRADSLDLQANTLSSDLPVYFSGGYGNVKSLPYLLQMAHSGRSAFAVSFGRGRQSDTALHAYSAGSQETLTLGMRKAKDLLIAVQQGSIDIVVAQQQIRKAASLLAVMEAQGITQTDAIFQSEGALHGLLAAYARPDMFHSIVFAYPAGIGGQDQPRVVSRNVAQNVAQKLRDPVETANSFKYIAKDNPAVGKQHRQRHAPGAMVDGATVAFSNYGPLLHALRQVPKAPHVALVAGLNDVIYPPERFLRTLYSASDINYMLVTDGAHGISYRRDVMEQIMPLLRHEPSKTQTPLSQHLILPANISADRAQQLQDLAAQLDARG